ncbi:C4-dicarboxylate TRAP transporter substrate-binding protein [Roseibium sp. RKSG952]|uniref:C4-dicarboxylate TRAP transporter substrate-binding protein n=1 Tax=Roseibium sp. RKSG952 TaxID=2529384 RepID=UPI0012BCAE97|nr:C4-dicarboxylate TRAP transporter substrate-binding protein [Roseibium sp. RKSG952]MTH95975.1 C4-dicarboxylate ABC transporter substrate-binding protein [Roseibium sp. RKSG952]
MLKFRNLAAGLAVAASLALPAAAETVIYYSHNASAKGTIPTTLNWYKDRVAELSAGDIRIELQWGSALFKATAAVQGIGDGVAEAGTVIAAYFQKEMAAYSLANLPISGSNAWVALKAADKFMRSDPQIAEHLAKSNLVYIGTFTGSAVNVGCSGDPIRSVDDIAGKKIRGTGVYGKVFGELGATRVNLSVFEAYQALDTGLIDCTQGYTYVVPALKWNEVMDNYTVLNWGQVGGVGFFMNKQFFDDLSQSERDILVQAGAEMADVYGRIVTGFNAKVLAGMRSGAGEHPIEVIDLSAEDTAKLNAAAGPFIEEWKDNAASVGLDPVALMASFEAAVEEYTAEFEAQGYPWDRATN